MTFVLKGIQFSLFKQKNSMMSDVASISSVLSSIKIASDIVKVLKDSEFSHNNAEVKIKLAELIESLADAKTEIAEIQSLLYSKDKQIDVLLEKLIIKENLTWDPPYYWVEKKSHKDGPYCQYCYDDKSKLIRLQGGDNGVWICLACNNTYKDSSYVEPPF